MASQAAQAFFNQQSPADQAAIRASWGGKDMMDQWYQNAGSPTAAPAGPSEAEIRQAAEGKSEDFSRFQAGDLERWAPFYDKAASKAAGRPQYKSSRGAPGYYDKPTECPAGQSPAGPDETSPCKSNQELLAAQGAGKNPGVATPGATTPAESTADFMDPLQARLMEMFGGGEGTFNQARPAAQNLEGGGVWWSGQGATPGATVPGVTPAIAEATMNAFNPNKGNKTPDAVGTTYTDPYEAAKQGGGVTSSAINIPMPAGAQSFAAPTTPATPATTPAGGENALTAAVNRRYKNPNAWWTSGNSY